MSQLKQRKILQFARSNDGKVCIDDCYKIPGIDTYYCNSSKYIGEILGRLVRLGILERIKPGHFKLKHETSNTPNTDGKTQTLW